MQIVVTGGAGFIGANLVAELVGRPEVSRVVVIDDLSAGSRDNLEGLAAELLVGSVLDADLLADACSGADAIAHLAARASVPRSLADPLATHEANATGTLRVLEAARAAGGLHTVVASSSSVYGDNPTLPKHEALLPAPLSPYAASKAAAEAYAMAYASSFGVPVTTFRFFNVFGPLQPAGHAYAAVIPVFIDAALRGRALPVHGDGLQTRDFTYVGSVVEVLATALLGKVVSPEPVNLAFGSRHSLLDVIAHLEEAFGHPLGREHTDPRPGDVRHSQADQERLRALFGDARPVPFAQGLASTLAWFRTLPDYSR
jgi:UDP-glucose 4-epimerase